MLFCRWCGMQWPRGWFHWFICWDTENSGNLSLSWTPCGHRHSSYRRRLSSGDSCRWVCRPCSGLSALLRHPHFWNGKKASRLCLSHRSIDTPIFTSCGGLRSQDCSLIVLTHEDIYSHTEGPTLLSHLEYLADTIIRAEPLRTGLSADVHGQVLTFCFFNEFLSVTFSLSIQTG